ncbi:MAG: L-fucose/L-arabinose isomerase family protein [Sedimentisphaerales bacterium]|nr:L-fucose/L-arabinose isomerase family protein [Sedimentisphaerales bacterium]
MNTKQNFAVIVTSRNIFPAQLAIQERLNISAKLDELGFGFILLGEDEVPNGAVETYSDAKKCAALFKQRRDDINGVIVVLPNFGDEQAVTQAIDMAQLNVPVLVQACDETDATKLALGKRRDSFCGKLSLCNNLYQYGIPFTNTTYHTCHINDDIFTEDLNRFAAVCRVVNGLRSARIGAIGARPEAFQTVRFSEKLLQASGIKVVTVDLSEIFSAADGLKDDATDVRNKVKAIKNYGKIPTSVSDDKIVKQAKLSVAIDNWMTENECVASAIQCWTSVQQHYGCAACLSMSMMGEQGKPSACEMDVAGTVSMYALNLASGDKPSGFVDWNNDYGNQRDKCVVTHCSNYPKSFVGGEIEISELDVLGESLGRDNCFAGIKGRIAPGDMTFARISTDDTLGLIKAYVGEGEFTDDPLECDGGVGVCEIPGLQGLLDFLCRNGFEHHVAMNRGHYADALEEAFGTYLGWDVYNHS